MPKHSKTVEKIKRLFDNHADKEASKLLSTLEDTLQSELEDIRNLSPEIDVMNKNTKEILMVLIEILPLVKSYRPEKALAQTLRNISILYYQFSKSNHASENEKMDYIESAINSMEEALDYDKSNNSFLREYFFMINSFSIRIKNISPEIAENLYFKIIEHYKHNKKEYKDLEEKDDSYYKLFSNAYNFLGEIYFKYYGDKELNLGLNVNYHHLKDIYNSAYKYYKKSYKMRPTESTNHMLSTLKYKMAQNFRQIHEVESDTLSKKEKKSLLNKSKKSFEKSIYYSEKHNDLRKLGTVQYKYSLFLFHFSEELKIKPIEYYSEMKSAFKAILNGLLKDNQLSKNTYDELYDEYLDTFNIIPENYKKNTKVFRAFFEKIYNNNLKDKKRKYDSSYYSKQVVSSKEEYHSDDNRKRLKK